MNFEKIHKGLNDIVADAAAKALRGETGGYGGMSPDDVEKIISLVLSGIKIEFYPAAAKGGDEYRLYAALKIGDDVEREKEASENLAENIIKRAEECGLGADFVSEYREYLTNTVAKLYHWVVANS